MRYFTGYFAYNGFLGVLALLSVSPLWWECS